MDQQVRSSAYTWRAAQHLTMVDPMREFAGRREAPVVHRASLPTFSEHEVLVAALSW